MTRFFEILDERLRRPGSERFWFRATVLLGLLAAVRELVLVFRPIYRLQNDGLQFTSWMARWLEPALRKPDLVLDYWYSVTPWGYGLVFRVAFSLGLEPIVTTKFVGAILLVLFPLAAFRLGRGLKAEPGVCFMSVVALLAFAGSLPFEGVPRSFWPIFLILVVDGLIRRRIWQTVIAQGLLAAFYPQATLVAAGMIGLSPLLPGDGRWVDLSRWRMLLVAACAAATVASLLPTVIRTDSFGPVATLSDARAIPTFHYNGRTAVLEPDGSADYVCGERLGFFAVHCSGAADPRFWFWLIILLAAPTILLLRTLSPRSLAPDVADKAGIRTPVIAPLIVSGIIWTLLAQFLLFDLHLPNRYSGTSLLIAVAATTLLVCETVRRCPFPEDLARRSWGRWLLSITAVAIIAGAAASALTIDMSATSPDRPAIVAAAAETAPETRLAGFIGELDYVPVFAQRSVFFSRELAVAYQLGYFQRIQERMEYLRRLVQTTDKAELAHLLAQDRFDILLVDDDTLADGRVPRDFQIFFPSNDPVAGTTALSALAAMCRIKSIGSVSLLNASCLRSAAPVS